MNEDAYGFLHSVIPICLRMGIYIVNIDSTTKARKNPA